MATTFPVAAIPRPAVEGARDHPHRLQQRGGGMRSQVAALMEAREAVQVAVVEGVLNKRPSNRMQGEGVPLSATCLVRTRREHLTNK